ncbi:MAG: DUF1648 domain-containing protein [Deltaproteobacteria bacterium]|nr:DUF1648 domain-containing protein [Deltaproteobacteria bacterium]MCB9785684.1 DUF1648 domain-containing protein [Deltaproteobacteria bacterium]
MTRHRRASLAPAAFFALAAALPVVELLVARRALPDPMASHFAGDGRPDGWMSFDQVLLIHLLVGAAQVLIFGVLPAWLGPLMQRRARFIRVPRGLNARIYRDESTIRRAASDLRHYMHALGACMVLTLASAGHGTIQANLAADSRLEPVYVIVPLALTLACALGGTAWLVLRLRRL